MLKRLLLRNFRSYREAEFIFSPGINLIQGENGQGKTNLLDAIHLVSTGRSFRSSSLAELICFDESFFYLEAEFYKEGVSQELKIYYDETTRRIQYNQTIYPTLASLLGILPSVLLSPDDISLISGNPAERRRFLDLHIAQTDPLYIHHLARYFKAMKQRNHLLRSQSEAAIDAWEHMMAQAASYIVAKRQQAVSALNPSSASWMQTLTEGRDEIGLGYVSSLSLAPEPHALVPHFQRLFHKHRPREMQMGATLFGPHRDDLEIDLLGKSAKAFSSEGQKRSCTCALRFAQWEHMAKAVGHPPLLAIDDFGVQLDKTRQLQLKAHLPAFGQVFLTSPSSLEKDFGEGSSLQIFTIEKVEFKK